ncbi:coproporphyrinogen III oxidase family protein [Campylobacter sp. TTU-622]|uniref:radical SAM family heme chaperone HemW n=1 Tax=Campylobacter sp. TTU-622 TaxID=2800583 RepID=UPI00190813E8|nr:radical SAM family heme chaperone HemW [Campylobacter sp. TTU-622]MBK1973245.1 coproporphyrinogen III oxidase family protein [Campylobacter sp. TTU-622]
MYHLYIHIPFCESKCYYCSFTSLKKKNYEDSYFNALKKDLKFQLDFFKVKKNSIKTLFIGGGTPSIIQTRYYEEIFKILEPFLSKNLESTCETNPNSTSLEWLKEMKNFGLNRISFGAQSFHPKKLKFLGRIHSQDMIFKVLENANKANFKNINLDLIYDTKMDDKKMLEFELLNLKKIKPLITHLSAYNLSIEPKTIFAKKEHFKKNAPYLMKFFINNLKELGFFQYEISNFAKNKTYICKHNLAYWQGKAYIGCGLSAIGFLKNQRFYTVKNLKDYIANPTFRKIENLSLKDLNLEHLFLGFRSIVGIKESHLNTLQKKKAALLVKEKKLHYKKGRFYNLNFLLSDELALYF